MESEHLVLSEAVDVLWGGPHPESTYRAVLLGVADLVESLADGECAPEGAVVVAEYFETVSRTSLSLLGAAGCGWGGSRRREAAELPGRVAERRAHAAAHQVRTALEGGERPSEETVRRAAGVLEPEDLRPLTRWAELVAEVVLVRTPLEDALPPLLRGGVERVEDVLATSGTVLETLGRLGRGWGGSAQELARAAELLAASATDPVGGNSGGVRGAGPEEET